MVNPFDLSGRVAVVTGALGSLGSLWTATLLDAGASVAALDLPDAKPDTAFPPANPRLAVLRADVCDRASLEAAAAACSLKLGAPSILVNNAGIDQPPDADAKRFRIEDIPPEALRRVLDVNTVGLFQCAQVFARPMLAARRGSIVNIGSLYAEVSPDARLYDHLAGDPPFLKPPAYGASKAAVVALTKYLATHWAKQGVRVNALSPGGVQAGQDAEFVRKYAERVPMGRMARKEDLAGPLLFLASDASSYVTGVNLVVDGGFTAW